MQVDANINGKPVRLDLEAHELLLDVLRDRLGLTGPKGSCGVQVCGTCTVLVDGDPVSACCYLAFEIGDREVVTIEGLRSDPRYAEIEAAFVRNAAVQCGFCIPGMVTTLAAALETERLRTRADVARALRGNLCRCTGYRAILDSACEVAGVTEGGERQ